MLYSRQSIASKNPANKPTSLDKTVYEFIKTIDLIGLGISSGYELQSLYDEGCTITPSVVVMSGSPMSVFWDFGVNGLTLNDSKSIAYINDYFSVNYFKSGDGIVVSNSSYKNDDLNFNGSFTFISFKNNILTTTTNLSLTPGKYSNYNFDSVPVFIKSPPGLKTFNKNEFLITNNVTGSNSFILNGVQENSILEIGDIKFKVIRIEQKTDKEYILITGINQSNTITIPILNITSRNLINLYKQR